MNIQPLSMHSQMGCNSTSFQAKQNSLVSLKDVSVNEVRKLRQYLKYNAGGGSATDYSIKGLGQKLMVMENNPKKGKAIQYEVERTGNPSSDEAALIKQIQEAHKSYKSAFNFLDMDEIPA